MPPLPAPPLPETVTSGQLARLLGVSERAINGRKSDGRLPVSPATGKIDLRLVVRRGLDACADAQRGRPPLDELAGEVFSLVSWVAVCVRTAMGEPLPGEDPDTAAARGLRKAVEGDNYFIPPVGWRFPERVRPEADIFSGTDGADEDEEGEE